MQRSADGLWMAVMCLGILVTALAATVCVSMIAYYLAAPGKVYPVLATFGAGAVMMLTAATQLDRQASARRRNIR
ncbi:MAG: hypothetical protein AB7P40_21470 [Chloroflexota bacterium]